MKAILGAIFNISKRSMMPEWHQLDSSCTMSEQQESMEKKTLKSSSRSFLFSTGLILRLLSQVVTSKKACCQESFCISAAANIYQYQLDTSFII